MKLERPLCFLDIETTGVDIGTARILELGVSILHPDDTVKPKGWSQRFNPECPIPPESTEIHGITDADVKDCPTFTRMAPKILKSLAGKDLAGYNLYRLDLPVLDEDLRRAGLRLDLTGVRVIDVAGIFFKREPRDLAAAVARYCGRSHEDAHGAAADADATLDVLKGQLTAYPELDEMSLTDLAAYSRLSERPLLDMAGKLYRDAEGFVCFAFGKHKDKRITDASVSGYVWWILNKAQDFPQSTLEEIEKELHRVEEAA